MDGHSRGTPALRGFDLRGATPNTPVEINAGGETVVMAATQVLELLAPNAPPADAMRFLFACRSAKVNPLLGEAYLLPMGGKWAFVVSKSGYLKRAQEHPLYDGHESGLIVTNGETGEIKDTQGAILPKNWLLLGAWARAWRKGVSRPVERRVSFGEYRKDTATWKSMPLTMIEKVAVVAVIREAFGFSEGYDESEYNGEVPSVMATPAQVESAVAPNRATVPALAYAGGATSYRNTDTIGYVRPDLVARIGELFRAADFSRNDVIATLDKRGVQNVLDLTVSQAEEIVIKLEALVRESQADEVFGASEATQGEAKPAEVLIPEVVRPGESEAAQQ